jgi:anti-sigma factor RsiW
MTCANPIAWPTLVDYWAGDLSDAETAVVDEHLFGCTDCTAASARVGAVAQALRSAIPPVVLRSAVDRMRARGTRIRENGFAPGDRREVEFSADAELLIHRLGGLDLTGAARVDLRITAESTGALVSAFDAVPFDRAEGAVLIACQRHYADLPHDTVMSLSIHPTPTGAAAGAPPQTATYTILHRFL